MAITYDEVKRFLIDSQLSSEQLRELSSLVTDSYRYNQQRAKRN